MAHFAMFTMLTSDICQPSELAFCNTAPPYMTTFTGIFPIPLFFPVPDVVRLYNQRPVLIVLSDHWPF